MTKRSIIAVSILVAIIIIGLFLQTPLMRSVRGFAWDIWTKTIAHLYGLGPLQEDRTVTEQLQALRAENIRLQAEVVDYKRLRDQLGSPAFESFRALPAAILARPVDTFQVQFVINRGAAEGVQLGSPIVLADSILVGFVNELHEHTAVFQLLMQPETNLTVEIVGRESTEVSRGLLKGQHYTSLLLTTVPRDVTLQEGQSVVTVAKGKEIPPGLLIGTLQNIKRPENEAYQEAHVALPYDPDSLEAVSVLIIQSP